MVTGGTLLRGLLRVRWGGPMMGREIPIKAGVAPLYDARKSFSNATSLKGLQDQYG